MKYDNVKPFAGVICKDCGHKDLTLQQYMNQMNNPFDFWRCPICSEHASFNDARYEELQGQAYRG